MKKLFKSLAVSLIILSGIIYVADAESANIDFEDIAPGASYSTGAIFISSGIAITCKDFQWSNGTWTSGGRATAGNNLMAGGSGIEMGPGNINMDFNFGTELSSLSLRFGEYGGNINIEINGTLKNTLNFSDINGLMIGNVQVKVVNGFGNNKGILELTGAISQFAIGGQELWIDDITLYKEVIPDTTFDNITLADIKLISLSSDKINGSDSQDNQIPADTVLVYQSNEGRYGKMKILSYGYNLTIKWVTYNSDGSVFSNGENLLIKGTWNYDMDYGIEETSSSSLADFWWEQVDSTIRYIVPKNSAKFSILRADVIWDADGNKKWSLPDIIYGLQVLTGLRK